MGGIQQSTIGRKVLELPNATKLKRGDMVGLGMQRVNPSLCIRQQQDPKTTI
jgi:hypothetical protein